MLRISLVRSVGKHIFSEHVSILFILCEERSIILGDRGKWFHVAIFISKLIVFLRKTEELGKREQSYF